MKKRNRYKTTKTIILLYSILIVIGCCLFLYLDYINILLYYDDSYTLQMIKRDTSEMFTIIARSDLHPPLYYLMLKGYTSIFGDSIFAGRAFSTLAILAMMLLAVFPIRRRFGNGVSLWFLVILVLLPVTQFLSTEIRMYSWSMFFVLATAICAYDVYDKGRNIDWLKLGFLAICSAFIHYYALITAIWIFVVLFIALLLGGKMKWMRFIVTTIVCGIIYAPWVLHLFYHLQRASLMTWAQPESWYERIYYFYYFYSIKKEWLPTSDSIRNLLMFGAAVIIALQAILVLRALIRVYKEDDKLSKIGIISLILFLLPVLTGITVSYFLYPILTPRYMTIMLGLFILAFAIFLTQAMDSKLFKTISITFILILGLYGAVRYYASVSYYKKEQVGYTKMQEFVKSDANKPHIFLSEYYATAAMSRLSIFYPDSRFFVLMREGWYDDFAPFRFEKVNHEATFARKFILVQKPGSEDDGLGAAFKEALDYNYITTDSLAAVGIVLYKMKARPIKTE